MPGGPPLVAALLKRVDFRPEFDPLSGAVTRDPHGGLSEADRSALEVALLMAERVGTSTLAVTAGPPEAEVVLRQALEAGASAAVRVDLPEWAPSATVGAVLADVVGGCRWIWCGDHSLDRGSGSVPGFVAGHLDAAQALGVATVELGADPGGLSGAWPSIKVERRLDGGRREVLAVTAPAVISVESGTAALRRSPLGSVLAAARVPVQVVPAPPGLAPPSGRSHPFRPRPRVLEGPDAHLPPHERMLRLSGALVAHEPPRVVRADPDEAAQEVLAFLAARGYLPASGEGEPASDGCANPPQ